MAGSRTQSRLVIATAVLALAIGACGPLAGTAAPGPTATVVEPSATPTQHATPEIFSPTAIPVFASPTAIVSTTSPDLTPTIAPAPAACNPPAGPDAGWLAYCDTRSGFGFRYPSDGTPIDDSQGYPRLYLPVSPGTNLLEKFLDVYVTEGATTCDNSALVGNSESPTPPESVSFNGITFIKQQGSGVGAGNLYEATGYSTLRGSLCVSLNFTLHSANRLNYATPPPEFDEAAESAVFGQVMATFSWINP